MTDLERLTQAARALTAPERAKLIEILWDTLGSENQDLQVPNWHQEELDRRLAAHEAGHNPTVPWEEARARLATRNNP